MGGGSGLGGGLVFIWMDSVLVTSRGPGDVNQISESEEMPVKPGLFRSEKCSWCSNRADCEGIRIAIRIAFLSEPKRRKLPSKSNRGGMLGHGTNRLREKSTLCPSEQSRPAAGRRRICVPSKYNPRRDSSAESTAQNDRKIHFPQSAKHTHGSCNQS